MTVEFGNHLSRKGPWCLSRSIATQTAMTNKWLNDQGLISVKGLGVNIHYPATARECLLAARCGPACRVMWGLGEKSSGYPITHL